jgi:predicted DNA-binding ribbon-helix-helix protein
MSLVGKKTGRGPMIHIRLNRETHTSLKMIAAKKETTIQKMVEDLIIRNVKRHLTKEPRG